MKKVISLIISFVLILTPGGNFAYAVDGEYTDLMTEEETTAEK